MAFEVFFSDPVKVRGGGVQHEPGEVHAYFRNGKFTNIVKHGKFAIPVLRRTLVGHIQLINISTASHEIAFEVRDVTTKDGINHPLVRVRLLARLPAADNYSGVAKMLTQHGMAIAPVLEATVSKKVDAQVRRSFAMFDWEELLSGHLNDTLGFSSDELSSAAVEVVEVRTLEWQKNADVQRLLSMRSSTTTMELEHEIAIARQAGEHDLESLDTVHQLEIEEARAAKQLKIDMERAEGEERYKELEHQRELATIQTTGLMESISKLFESGRGSSKDLGMILHAFDPSPRPTDVIGAPPEFGRIDAAIDAAAHTSSVTPTDIPALNMDARLRRIWKECGLPEVVAGCAASADGGVVGVVYVLSDWSGPMLNESDVRALENRLGESYHADDCRLFLLPLTGSRTTLVENYLAQAVQVVHNAIGGDAIGQFDISLELDDESLCLQVAGSRASEVRKLLADPAACLLNPVVTLLALEYAEVNLSA